MYYLAVAIDQSAHFVGGKILLTESQGVIY